MDMPGADMPMNPLGVSMERSGSGTTWIPDAASLPSHMFTAGKWDLMLHEFIFAQYDHQGGPRGADQIGSLNWAMLMASHDLGGGRLRLSTMLSLDAATVSKRGYPQLLQNGETFLGQPLVDRQHPHDFFMEVAAMYDRAIGKNLALELYVAPSGEPALGPVAFMHRLSSMDNPMAPIGHHWQDVTHESFGVATIGVFSNRWKLEGSVFNGREPDENRWNFDIHPLDSYSARFTFLPDSQWSMSAGFGFVKSPESADPGHSMHRTVLAVQQARPLGMDGQIAHTFMWTAMAHSDQLRISQSALAELEAVLNAKNTVFGRAEFVQKTVDDLVLPIGPVAFTAERMFDIGALSLGYIREIASGRGVTLGAGAIGTVNVVPSSLQPFYGSRTPVGAMLFVRLRAARGGKMNGMNGMAGMVM